MPAMPVYIAAAAAAAAQQPSAYLPHPHPAAVSTWHLIKQDRIQGSKYKSKYVFCSERSLSIQILDVCLEIIDYWHFAFTPYAIS